MLGTEDLCNPFRVDHLDYDISRGVAPGLNIIPLSGNYKILIIFFESKIFHSPGVTP